AAYFTMLDQLVHDLPDHVDGNSEADADVAAGRTDDGGVDADQVAVQIHQRPARITGVDGSVGLNEVFIGLDAQAGTAQCADDTGGGRLSQPERIADRHDKIAD